MTSKTNPFPSVVYLGPKFVSSTFKGDGGRWSTKIIDKRGTYRNQPYIEIARYQSAVAAVENCLRILELNREHLIENDRASVESVLKSGRNVIEVDRMNIHISSFRNDVKRICKSIYEDIERRSDTMNDTTPTQRLAKHFADQFDEDGMTLARHDAKRIYIVEALDILKVSGMVTHKATTHVKHGDIERFQFTDGSAIVLSENDWYIGFTAEECTDPANIQWVENSIDIEIPIEFVVPENVYEEGRGETQADEDADALPSSKYIENLVGRQTAEIVNLRREVRSLQKQLEWHRAQHRATREYFKRTSESMAVMANNMQIERAEEAEEAE